MMLKFEVETGRLSSFMSTSSFASPVLQAPPEYSTVSLDVEGTLVIETETENGFVITIITLQAMEQRSNLWLTNQCPASLGRYSRHQEYIAFTHIHQER